MLTGKDDASVEPSRKINSAIFYRSVACQATICQSVVAAIDLALSRIVETSVSREFREIREKVEHLPSCKQRRDRVTSAAVYLRGV